MVARNESLGKIHILRGQYHEALELFQSVPESGDSVVGLAIAYYKTGLFDEANVALKRLETISGEVHAPFALAVAYSEWGEIDKAFELIDKIPYNVWNVAYEPYFRNLHDDPRWKPALARMKSPFKVSEEHEQVN